MTKTTTQKFPSLRKEAHDGHFGADGFAGAGGRAHKHVLVAVVDGVEDLRLDWVELDKVVLVQALVVLVPGKQGKPDETNR